MKHKLVLLQLPATLAEACS